MPGELAVPSEAAPRLAPLPARPGGCFLARVTTIQGPAAFAVLRPSSRGCPGPQPWRGQAARGPRTAAAGASQGACANVSPPLYSSEDAMKAGWPTTQSSRTWKSRVLEEAQDPGKHRRLSKRQARGQAAARCWVLLCVWGTAVGGQRVGPGQPVGTLSVPSSVSPEVLFGPWRLLWTVPGQKHSVLRPRPPQGRALASGPRRGSRPLCVTQVMLEEGGAGWGGGLSD